MEAMADTSETKQGRTGGAYPSPRSNCYTNRICRYCHWWHDIPRDPNATILRSSKRGLCTRFPPVESRKIVGMWAQPNTHESESCGEFKSLGERYDRTAPEESDA